MIIYIYTHIYTHFVYVYIYIYIYRCILNIVKCYTTPCAASCALCVSVSTYRKIPD